MDQSLIDEKPARLADHMAWRARLPVDGGVQHSRKVQPGVPD
jgi:hypothetical protein